MLRTVWPLHQWSSTVFFPERKTVQECRPVSSAALVLGVPGFSASRPQKRLRSQPKQTSSCLSGITSARQRQQDSRRPSRWRFCEPVDPESQHGSAAYRFQFHQSFSPSGQTGNSLAGSFYCPIGSSNYRSTTASPARHGDPGFFNSFSRSGRLSRSLPHFRGSGKSCKRAPRNFSSESSSTIRSE
jgi:hypothetical protein